jgi:DNA-binding NarL/FixJ family response regulator
MNSTYRIIIVDDHQMVIDGVKSMLANSAYTVVAEATDGRKGLEIIHSNPNDYDVLITDIGMPLLSGTDLCRMVKQDYMRLKVLMLSMYSSPPIVKEAVMAEADGFILKSSGKDELLKALYKIVNNSTHYSDEIIPIIYNQIEKEKKQKENTEILSDREREILKLIVKELTSEQIAHKLNISKRTVDNHRTHILEKTRCKSTIGLVKYALKNAME